MSWKTFNGQVRGLYVRGDASVPPTRWWNHLWLLFFIWKKVTVLRPAVHLGSYRVGYVPFKGRSMVLDKPLNLSKFAVRNGHEDCTFFAVADNGNEVELVVVEQTTTDALEEDTALL